MRFFLMSLCLLWGAASVSLSAPIPNLNARDQKDRPFQAHSLKGSYILISFVFSSCPMPKMCPLTMRLNKKTQDLWKKSMKAPLKLLIVTLDPLGDTPAILDAYGKRFALEPESTFLVTGDTQALTDFGSFFNVAGWPSGNTTVHNLKTILVGPDLEEIKQFKENEWTPEQVIGEAKKLARK